MSSAFKIFFILFVLTVATVLGAPIPAPNNEVAAFSNICEQWGFSVSGQYTLYNNLWNMDAGAGNQCSQMQTQSDGSTTWTTSWNWQYNDDQVKSFSNVETTITPAPLNQISAIHTAWNWYYTDNALKADIAFDTFTAPTATSAAEFEVMVWVGNIGAAVPLSYSGQPIASPVIAGITWDLWKGPRGDTNVFSFVARENQYDFGADLMHFFWNLINDQGLPADQVLISAHAGTESFTGSNAEFHTTHFILDQVLY